MTPVSKPDLTAYENEATSFDEVMKRLIKAKPKQRALSKKREFRPAGEDHQITNPASAHAKTKLPE